MLLSIASGPDRSSIQIRLCFAGRAGQSKASPRAKPVAVRFPDSTAHGRRWSLSFLPARRETTLVILCQMRQSQFDRVRQALPLQRSLASPSSLECVLQFDHPIGVWISISRHSVAAIHLSHLAICSRIDCSFHDPAEFLVARQLPCSNQSVRSTHSGRYAPLGDTELGMQIRQPTTNLME